MPSALLGRDSTMQHRNTRWRSALIASFAGALAACGGSGGGNEPEPPPAVSEDVQNARNAQLKMVLREDTHELAITWIDTFSAERGYRIEAQSATGAWEALESLPATSGTGSAFEWSRIIDRSTDYRVVALRDNYSVPLEVEPGQTEVTIDITATQMSLQIDQPEPVQGGVQLSTQNAGSARSVTYFVDLDLIATSTASPTFTATWDSSKIADGEHLLIAQVHTSGGAIVELRRTVAVDNPNIAISLGVTGTSPSLLLHARATSNAGLRSVEFFLNDVSLAVFTAPTSGRVLKHPLDTRGLPAGPATFRVVAIDNEMETAEAQRQIVIDNPPTVTLDSPVNGAIVSGQLEITGSFADDQPGAVVTVSIGQVQILQTSTSPFAAGYSLAGLPGGEYTVVARARDSDGKETTRRSRIVVSSTELSYERIDTAVSEILDTELGALLYRKQGGPVILRSAAGAETTLDVSADLVNVDGWQLSGNRVAMFARGPAPASNSHVYVFDGSGEATNISEETGSTYVANTYPLLRGDWLIWAGYPNDGYTIYNLDTHALLDVPIPAGANYVGHIYDFVTTPGNEQLIFFAQTSGDGPEFESSIYRYRLSSDSTEVVTSSGAKQVHPQTDNVRMAWQKSPSQQIDPPYQLIVAPVSNPTASTILSSSMMTFQLSDGLLAWIEGGANSPTLKVNDGSATAPNLSSVASTTLYSVADGHVIFGENGKLYVWSDTAGKRTLLDALPYSVVQDNGIAFLLTGGSQKSVHRVELP